MLPTMLPISKESVPCTSIYYYNLTTVSHSVEATWGTFKSSLINTFILSVDQLCVM